MITYQDVYPSAALLRSFDVVRPRAADLLTLEYFEAEPARMPHAVFAQHHLLLNLRDTPMRVENWRDELYRDFTYLPDEIVLTPAGIRSGWHWHERSRVIVITLDPDRLRRFFHLRVGPGFDRLSVARHRTGGGCRPVSDRGNALGRSARPRTGSEVMYESLARIFLVKLLQRYGETRGEG